MILTIEELDRLVNAADAHFDEYSADDPEARKIIDKAVQMLEDMRKPITRENLLATGWRALYLDIDYVYGVPANMGWPPRAKLGEHVFFVTWDKQEKDVIREIGCIEDTGQFDDETVHATGISNMYELMEWVRSTGERA